MFSLREVDCPRLTSAIRVGTICTKSDNTTVEMCASLIEFVIQLLSNLELNITRKADLTNLRSLVSTCYSNRKVRENASRELILDVTQKIRKKFKITLNENVVKNDSASGLGWNSRKDYAMVGCISFDIMNDIIRCLRYIIDNRKELNHDLRSSIQNEIKEIESYLLS